MKTFPRVLVPLLVLASAALPSLASAQYYGSPSDYFVPIPPARPQYPGTYMCGNYYSTAPCGYSFVNSNWSSGYGIGGYNNGYNANPYQYGYNPYQTGYNSGLGYGYSGNQYGYPSGYFNTGFNSYRSGVYNNYYGW